MLASIYYKGQKVEKEQIENLLKTNPAESITIRTYNETGSILLQSPTGRRTTNTEEYLDDQDYSVFAQEQIIYPHDLDFKTDLQTTIFSFIAQLKDTIGPDLDDDEYFDDIPSSIMQILQYIHLVSLTGLFTKDEIDGFFNQLREQARKLNAIYPDEGDTINPELPLSLLNQEYLENEQLNYIAFN